MKINETINRYCEQKEVEKALKKDLSAMSTTIKDYMAGHADKDIDTGDYTVHIQERSKDVIDEEQMLEILKRDWIAHHGSMECPYIKTREYVDMEALESMIYNNEIANELLLDLDKCRVSKTERALTYKVNKKGEKDNE